MKLIAPIGPSTGRQQVSDGSRHFRELLYEARERLWHMYHLAGIAARRQISRQEVRMILKLLDGR